MKKFFCISFICLFAIHSSLASKEDFEKNLASGRKIYNEMRTVMNKPCGDIGLVSEHPDFKEYGETVLQSWLSMNRCDSIDHKVKRLECKLEDNLFTKLVSMGLAIEKIREIHNECRIKASINNPRREGKPVPQIEFSEESILIQKR